MVLSDIRHTGPPVYGNTIILSIDSVRGWVNVHVEQSDGSTVHIDIVRC